MGLGFTNPFGSNKGSDVIMKETVWQLTPLGEKKVKDYEGATNPRFTILAKMSELGPVTVEDISKHASIGQKVVEYNLRILKKSGFVQTIGANG